MVGLYDNLIWSWYLIIEVIYISEFHIDLGGIWTHSYKIFEGPGTSSLNGLRGKQSSWSIEEMVSCTLEWFRRLLWRGQIILYHCSFRGMLKYKAWILDQCARFVHSNKTSYYEFKESCRRYGDHLILAEELFSCSWRQMHSIYHQVSRSFAPDDSNLDIY